MPARITAAPPPPLHLLFARSLPLSVTLVAIRRKLRFLPNRKAKSHGIGRGSIRVDHRRMRLDPTLHQTVLYHGSDGRYFYFYDEFDR